MTDTFRTLDLTPVHNAGVANIDIGDSHWLWPYMGADPQRTALSAMPAGDSRFWGVPFRLGEKEKPHWYVQVADAGRDTDKSVTIAVGDRARRILFAHACAPVDGHWATMEGASLPVGRYLIRYADGTEVEQPLRRRWEIHDISTQWGHHPFQCRNCRTHHPIGINDTVLGYGRGQTGEYNAWFRADGSPAGGPTEMGHDLSGWWLFDFKNPHAEIEIREIVVEATSVTPIALGAVTLCDEEEDPFIWPSRKTIAVTVDGATAPPTVDMERGVIARQDDLFEVGEEYLTTDETGWGAGGQTVRRGGYVEVHGSAHGTLKVSDAEGGSQAEFAWGDVLADGKATDGPVRIEVVANEGTQWVHVRVVDED